MTLLERLPTLCVIGHTNEGKSSVVSTLAEDDAILVESGAGTTQQLEPFLVRVAGQPVFRLYDTPGFENPADTLAWFQSYQGRPSTIVAQFCAANQQSLGHEAKLLQPLGEGAVILLVVDGSRPIEEEDKVEMEILRLTGRPGIAVLNCKQACPDYLADWQAELRKYFNAVHLFNANRALFRDRMELIELFRLAAPDWRPQLERVLAAFQEDWELRLKRSARIIAQLIEAAGTHTETIALTRPKEARPVLAARFQQHLRQLEAAAHRDLGQLFKHRRYQPNLDGEALFRHDLFAEESWRMFGLDKYQMVIGSSLTGALIGAAVGLGVGAAVGLLAGGASGALTVLAGEKSAHLKGRVVDNQLRMKAPPQLLYMLLDRALLVLEAMIAWSHGRRDYPRPDHPIPVDERSVPVDRRFDGTQRAACDRYFQACLNDRPKERITRQKPFQDTLERFVLAQWNP